MPPRELEYNTVSALLVKNQDLCGHGELKHFTPGYMVTEARVLAHFTSGRCHCRHWLSKARAEATATA